MRINISTDPLGVKPKNFSAPPLPSSKRKLNLLYKNGMTSECLEIIPFKMQSYTGFSQFAWMFFSFYPKANFGSLPGRSFTHPMLITVLLSNLNWQSLGVLQRSWNQSPTECNIRIKTRNLQIQSWFPILLTLSHYATLPMYF